MKRVLLSWSGGKDSAWALQLLRQGREYEPAALLTTVNQAFGRVAIHGTRLELLRAQALAAGLPLWEAPLPWPCSNQQYEAEMAEVCRRARAEGVHGVVFGDLFLEDIRRYRVRQLAPTGLEPLFPLWGLDTAQLARDMLAAGVRAQLTCVDPKQLAADFAGREFDATLLAELPAAVDPCGENGEFHTFVYGGPMLTREIPIQSGETVTRDGFVYADLLSGS